MTLPGVIRWANNSPIWGASTTLVNMFSHDGNSVWAATLTFDAPVMAVGQEDFA